MTIRHRRVSPLEGGPHTTWHRDRNSGSRIAVCIRESTPEGVKAAGTASLLLGLVTIAFVAFTVKGDLWIWAVVGSIYTPFLYLAFFRAWMTVETRVEFTPAEFRVLRKGTFREHWDIYDRTLPHRFTMLPHDKAEQEHEDIEGRFRRTGYRGDRYFSKSFHIVFEYLGTRHDIATVFDQKRAREVFERLRTCDGFMEAESRISGGASIDPRDEWSRQPGGL